MKKTIVSLFFIYLCLAAAAEDNRRTLEDSVYQTWKKFDYFFLEALRLKENNKHSEAFVTLQYTLKINPASSAALALLADYYMYLQQDSLAVEALQKAVNYSPHNFDYKISLAELYRDIGKLAESTLLYEDLVTQQPTKPELNFYLSDLYLRQNQIEKAIQSLNALENNTGISEALSLYKYRLYFEMGQTENALKELEKLAGKYPAQAKYQALIGDFYLETDKLDKALMHYGKAQELEPQSPFYVVSMANYYEKTGDTEAATKEIESALKNPLLDFDIKLAILGRYAGNLLSDNKDAETANSLFQTLMEQHPQEKELNMIYGQFMLSQEKWEDARFQFQLVAEAEPENLLAWNLLLDIAVKEENTGEIIRICNSATVIFPDNVRFHFYKGMAHFQSKHYQKALNAFLEGINHIPAEDRQSLSMFYGQVGDLYHYLNQQDESFLAYEKALEYNENNISVLNNYAYFLSLAKEQLEKAERMSARTIRLQPNNSTFLDTYAWVFFQQGNYSLAKFYIESAISYGGNNNSVILEHYGDILFKTGNIDKAVEEWKKALETQEETENTALLEKKIKNRMYYESE